MARYVLGRVLQSLVVLWAAFTVTFAILYLLPSNPVQLQLGAAGMDTDKLTAQQLHDFEARYGLDQSLFHQYLSHLSGALHGDFGRSIPLNAPVSQVSGEAPLTEGASGSSGVPSSPGRAWRYRPGAGSGPW